MKEEKTCYIKWRKNMCEIIFEKNRLSKLQTPCYIFDLNILTESLSNIKSYIAQNHITYSMKANPFLVDDIKDKVGKIEVCSLGELEICISKNILPTDIMIAGINKPEEYLVAAIQYGVKNFIIESRFQWENLKRVCSLYHAGNVQAFIRVNIGNQFGMSISEAKFLTESNDDIISISGIHIYMGTQNFDIRKVNSHIQVLKKYMEEIAKSTHFLFRKIIIGCGAPVEYYRDAKDEWSDIWPKMVDVFSHEFPGYDIEYELGRKIAASCGKYITKVIEKKIVNEKTYIIVDGGTHQLNYYNQMYGRRIPFITQYPEREGEERYTICGSLCSASDILVFEGYLNTILADDILCFENAGAYTVTEGAYLFLSHPLPAIYRLSMNGRLTKIREPIKISHINGGYNDEKRKDSGENNKYYDC